MSTLTSTGNTPAATSTDTRRGLRLRGTTWVVWRQHRATHWTLLAAAAVCAAFCFYQRQEAITYLEGYGYPHLKDGWADGFPRALLDQTRSLLGLLPIVIGVFVGAPLLAGDLESGAAKLVSTQSISRVRWLTTKLVVTALVVVASTTVLSVAFTWWWSPVKSSNIIAPWYDSSTFDNTGPVPVALTLLTVFAGVAIGMLLRRTLLSMVVTLGFAVVVQVMWSKVRTSLGNVVTVTTHNGVGDGAWPRLPENANVLDQSYLTAPGDLIGWGTCASDTEKATEACLAKHQVVGWSIDYLPISQMSSMQWLGASVLLALTAGITAFIVLWGRKRLV
ncbi:ABC transporter permease subunit [Streptomyces chartreusis]|uniref:ABC transporter permease subunit n=1 Tax=Streptomyces chartreusis TaxID=1969 RepID=UPI0036B47AFF